MRLRPVSIVLSATLFALSPAAAAPASATAGPTILVREAGNTDAAFVNALYRDLLGRPASNADVGFGAGLLGGHPREVLVDDLLAGNEYLSLLVHRYYEQYLHREPAPTDVAFFSNALLSSGEEAVQASILGSAEYFANRAGSDTTAFIQAVYSDLLGRTASGPEVTQWLAYLSTHSRKNFAAKVLASNEYFARLVAQLYQQFLHRAPSGTESSNGVAQLVGGARDDQVIGALVTSGEYVPESWIQSLYQDLLGRDSDPLGAAVLSAFLSSHTRSEAAGVVLRSDEYRGRLVTGWYHRFLDRDPSSGERSTWVGVLGGGATDEQVMAAILGSPEYETHVGGTNAFVAALFQALLGRSPSPLELDQWATFRQTHSNQEVAASILSSQEYFARLVTGWYEQFLRRAPGTPDLNGWVTALTGGAHDENVIAALVGSGEYLGSTVVEGSAATVTVGTLELGGTSVPDGSAFTATIDWGDGTAPSAATVVGDGLGGYELQGTHTYDEEGVFDVTPSVSGPGVDGLTGVAGTVHVIDPAVSAASPRTVRAVHDSSFAGQVGSFTDPGLDTSPSDFPVTIHWGDGTVTPGVARYHPASGRFTIRGTHTYRLAGTYTGGVTIAHGLAAPVTVPVTAKVR